MKRVIPTPFPLDPFFSDARVLGAAVRAARTAAGLTVEDAALSIGVAKQTLSDLEAGKESVGLGLVLRITRDVGVALFVAPATQRERIRRMLTSTGNA
jgi:transcriptional regulator with XRE-family HTH domain